MEILCRQDTDLTSVISRLQVKEIILSSVLWMGLVQSVRKLSAHI